MNVDDLMAVWKSQDSAPLNSFNETLLRLALRQDSAKVYAQRRLHRWVLYFITVFLLIFYAVILVLSFEKMAGGFVAYLLLMAGAFVIAAPATYLRHRAQKRREQGFGDSLRDQLNRRMTQIDFQLVSARRVMRYSWSFLVLAISGGLMLVYLSGKWAASWASGIIGIFAFVFVFSATTLTISGWMLRSHAQRDLLPHKRRLEALLKQIDDQ